MLRTHIEEEKTPTEKEEIQEEQRKQEENSRRRRKEENMQKEGMTRAWARRWPRRRTELRRKDGRLLGSRGRRE